MKKQKKIEKRYEYTGFGFPVILHNVPMVLVRGEWTPNIKWNLLEKIVLNTLAIQPIELSGSQVRFIRHAMLLNQRDFAKLLHVTHAAVVKWEKKGNFAAKMQTTTEISLRLLILDQLIKNHKEFRDAYHSIISHDFAKKAEPVHIDTGPELIAI